MVKAKTSLKMKIDILMLHLHLMIENILVQPNVQSNITRMNYRLQVRYFCQQGNISYTEIWKSVHYLICETLFCEISKNTQQGYVNHSEE